ncbi:MAG: hypothetical protein P1P88_06540 [Bacteroidales bacterium]|nr:hypothetical protein [Bacteroidales bacterium]
MGKFILSIAFCFSLSQIQGQANDYFGSAIIPKNEYLIRLASADLYWSLPQNNEINITTLDKNLAAKVMFIPAGNGYYYIKFLSNGKYLQISDDNLNSGSHLLAGEPTRINLQKFKVIEKIRGQFKFITVNNLAIDQRCNKGVKLCISDDNNTEHQTFEIMEVKNMVKLCTY